MLSSSCTVHSLPHSYQLLVLVGPLDCALCTHWSANTSVSMCWILLKNFAYKFIPVFPVVPSMFCSSYMYSL